MFFSIWFSIIKGDTRSLDYSSNDGRVSMEFPIGTPQVPSSSHMFQGPISLGFRVQGLGFRFRV